MMMKLSAFLAPSLLLSSGDAVKPKMSPLRDSATVESDAKQPASVRTRKFDKGHKFMPKSAKDERAVVSPISTASLEGTYMIIEIIGSMEGAGLGTVDFDGEGNLSGTHIVNYPDPESPPAVADRIFWTTALSGTYELGDNGIGTINWTYEDPPEEFGDSLDYEVAILVTSNVDSEVLEFDGNYQTPSPFLPGRLISSNFIKRPENDRGGFFLDSVKGAYGMNLVGVGNGGIGFGVINFDGEGNIEGFMNGNGRGDDVARNLFWTPIVGTYTVEHHGFGFVNWQFTGPGFDFDIDFLIVASTEDGLATELRMQFQVPSPLLLGLVTTRMTLLGP